MAFDATKFDALIGTQGVITYEDPQFRKQTTPLQLRATKQDTGDNPLELRPEYGDMFGQADFSNGAGQEYFHHEGRNPRRFWHAYGVDILDPGRLKLLEDVATATLTVTPGAKAKLAVANDLPFVSISTVLRRGDGAFPGTWTEENPNANEGTGTSIEDLASSGDELYLALGVNGVYKRNTSGQYLKISAIPATRIEWLKQRLMLADGRSVYEFIAPTSKLTANQADFEIDATGWASDSNAVLSSTTAQIYSGAKAALIESSGAGLFRIRTTPTNGIPIAIGDTLTADAQVRTAVTTRNARIGIQWRDAAQALLSTTWGTAVADSTTRWTRITVTGAAPASTVYATVAIEWDGSGASEDHYVDYVSFFAGTDPLLPIETLPAGWNVEAMFETSAHIFACCNSTKSNRSELRSYALNDDATALEAHALTPFPDGQYLFSGLGDLGIVTLGVGKATSTGGYDPVVYEGVENQNGAIQYAKLVEDEKSGTLDLSVKAIAPFGESVMFGFTTDTSSITGRHEGLGIHHLSKDAVVRFLQKVTPSATPKTPSDIAFFKGRVLFLIPSDGLYYQTLGTYRAQGRLISSNADWNSAGQKVWDVLRVSHRPLPAEATVAVDYTLKNVREDSWTAAFTSSGTGSEGNETRLTAANKSRLFAMRLTLNATTALTGTPEVVGFEARSVPVPQAPEYRLTRYYRILAEDRKDENAEPVYQNPETVLAALRALQYAWVTLEEPEKTWTVFVESVGTIHPFQPIEESTTGAPSKQAYIVQMVMVAA